MRGDQIEPPAGRHLLAMLAAALAPALVMGVYGAVITSPGLFLPFFVFAFILAGLHVGLVALPLFAILSRRWRPRLWSISLAAFLVGSIPFLLLSLAGPGSDEEMLNGKMLVVHGVRTWDGWLFQLQAASFLGALGLSGGLAFWLVIQARGDRGIS